VFVTGGVFYASGGYENWKDGDALAAVVCDGMVESSGLPDLLGTDDLTATGASAGKCTVSASGSGKAALTVRIQQSADPVGLLADLGRENAHQGTERVSPVGHGWAAVLNTHEDQAQASGYLACGGGAEGDLVVSMGARRDPAGEPLDDAEQRTRLGQALTETLKRAAEKFGCDEATLGEEVATVPSKQSSALTPAGKAAGTCEGIASATYGSAADGRAPVEDCILADNSGEERFRIAAYYGPYAKAARLETVRGDQFDRAPGAGVYWATAACPSGEALYTVEPLDNGDGFVDPDPELERKALKTFAAASAARHGCPAPTYP
jgi:hypothetical protein